MTHAQATRRYPDFIIGGAMKAGTSTLRGVLAAHPQVFIPGREVHFFCLDDLTQHPDFPGPVRGRWVHLDYERDFETNVAWYAAIFGRARPDQLVGEHSTVYLASSRAAGRMAALLPAAKLVFLLRDPVMRAYSHYWHLVRAGRAVYGFEKTLRHGPATLLTRGYYKAQLEAWLERFPRENVKVLIFEEFVKDVQRSIDDVTAFLGLSNRLSVSGVDTHLHRGHVPRFPRLQLLQNRLFRGVLAEANRPDLPNVPQLRLGTARRLAVTADRGLRRLNPPSHGDRGPQPETRKFLEDVFTRENAGLSELLGIDLGRYWPCMRRTG